MNSNKNKIIIGVATVYTRRKFFTQKVLPGLVEASALVHVFRDFDASVTVLPDTNKGVQYYTATEFSRNLGDSGKFLGYESELFDGTDEFYYFSCDDDLIYAPEYFDYMIAAIERFDRKAVVSLHGNTFHKFPINSYYGDKKGYSCLRPNRVDRRVLFPGTGVMAFHSSLIRDFILADLMPVPNMADIWMGLELQKRKIPAVTIKHNGNLLTYHDKLPVQQTIWGQAFNNDFIQTALVNQFSLNPGFALYPLVQPHNPQSE